MNDFFFKVDITLKSNVKNGRGYFNHYIAELVRKSDLEVLGSMDFYRLNVEGIMADTGSCQVLGDIASLNFEFTCAFDWLMANSADDHSRFFNVKSVYHQSVEKYCDEKGYRHRGNITYIEELKLKPSAIGKGLGEYLLKAISNYFGDDDGMIALQSCPLQLCSHLSISREYKALGDKKPDVVRQKLLAWYASKGFKQIEEGTHDWLFATSKDLSLISANPHTELVADLSAETVNRKNQY